MMIAVVGSTGAVGNAMLGELAAAGVPSGQVRCLASPRSAGSEQAYGEDRVVITALGDSGLDGCSLAFFAAGARVSREWVPGAVDAGVTVIDKTSAYRMDPAVPLVVPEVNGHVLTADPPPRLVSNPNCSAIELVCALAPLDRAFGLTEVVVSTYQSVSGAGRRALETLESESRRSEDPPTASMAAPDLDVRERAGSPFPHPIAFNVIPEVGSYEAGGDTGEEEKIRAETRRILERPDLPVHATAVRVPTRRGHGESVLVRCRRAVTAGEAARVLAAAPGLVVDAAYTTARAAEGRREVFVGRLRGSADDPRVLQFWIMSDNLLKGAAWNAVQIARTLGLIG